MAEIVETLVHLLAERRKLDRLRDEQAAAPIQGLRWNNAHTLNQTLWDYLDRAVSEGASDPEQPIELTFDEACLLNFATTPDLLVQDRERIRAETEGESGKGFVSVDAQDAEMKNRLGRLELQYGEDHGTTAVYNLEPWLQEMFRDCLDFDYRETLRHRLRNLQEELQAVPTRLLKMGMPQEVVQEVMGALREFDLIRDASYTRERHKTSILNVRDFSQVLGRIEETMARAERYVKHYHKAGGEGWMRDLFGYWRSSTFDLFDLRRELGAYSLGGLGPVLLQLTARMAAVRSTLLRCSENLDVPEPQCGVIGYEEADQLCPRQMVEDELQALQMYDLVGRIDSNAERMEARRFGPLSLLFLPGRGAARYSSEMREQHIEALGDNPGKRDYDLERRATYPLNVIVIPSLLPMRQVSYSLADAFLEFKSYSAPAAYRQILEETRRRFSGIYDTPEEDMPQTLRGDNRLRKRLALYLEGFLHWAKYGEVRDLPRMKQFNEWAAARMSRPTFFAAPRYRGVLEDFKEGSANRRDAIFQEHLDQRYQIDRRRFALSVVVDDIAGAAQAAVYLLSEHRQNRTLLNALKTFRAGGPGAKANAGDLLRRFIVSKPELKRDFLSIESLVSGQIDALRNRAAETLQKHVSHTEATLMVTQREREQLEQRRVLANETIDRDLVGLLYCVDKNYPAAREEFEAYLGLLERQREDRRHEHAVHDGSRLREMLGYRARRLRDLDPSHATTQTRLVGIEGGGRFVFEDDFVYYNLGTIERLLGHHDAALDYFSRFSLWASQRNWYLFGEHARVIMEEIEAEKKEKAESASQG